MQVAGQTLKEAERRARGEEEKAGYCHCLTLWYEYSQQILQLPPHLAQASQGV